MDNNIIEGKAIGKIILIGEHSVVYGQPAIAIPFLKAQIKASITKSTSKTKLDAYSFNGLLTDASSNLLGLTTVIKKVLEDFNQTPFGFDIKIESSIPAERGMGSSAAVSAATVRALYKFFNVALDNQKLTDLVNFSEKIYHGNPSGIDTAIVVNEKPLYYIKNQALLEFDYHLDAFLIVTDTGEKGNTKLAVTNVKSFIDNNVSLGNQIIKDLGNLTEQAQKVILKNNAKSLGDIMNQAQNLLSQLGVSNTMIDNLNKVAIENNALGSKLTGGGLGGCIISLCKSKKDAELISRKLLANGAKGTWIMDMRKEKRD